MRLPKRSRGQAGYVTAELAAAMPVLALFIVLGVFAVSVVGDQLRCTDAARESALAAARGEPTPPPGGLPPGATLTLDSDGRTVTAVVSMRAGPWRPVLPPLTVSASATVAVETGVTVPETGRTGADAASDADGHGMPS